MRRAILSLAGPVHMTGTTTASLRSATTPRVWPRGQSSKSTRIQPPRVFSSVAMDAAGDFVVTWASYGSEDGNAFGIFAQRYNSAGIAQGTEFQVNTYTTDRQFEPSVAMDAAGDFVITWQSAGQDGSG